MPQPPCLCTSEFRPYSEPVIVERNEACPVHGGDVEPASTVRELNDVLIRYVGAQDRTMQVELGPSELGGACAAQIARKLAGAPEKPTRTVMWAPFQGTAVHAEMEKVVDFWNGEIGSKRVLAEQTLKIDDGIIGHADAYDSFWNMVIDWKHTGTTQLESVRRAQRKGLPPAEQVKQVYRVQGHLYGWGFEQLGYKVEWVRLVFLARSWKFSDSVEWTERYNPDLVDWAINRYDSIKATLAALDVANNHERIALIQPTPGEDCGFCPFNSGGGGENSWASCPGDVKRHERIAARESEGIIA